MGPEVGGEFFKSDGVEAFREFGLHRAAIEG